MSCFAHLNQKPVRHSLETQTPEQFYFSHFASFLTYIICRKYMFFMLCILTSDGWIDEILQPNGVWYAMYHLCPVQVKDSVDDCL